MFSLSFLFSMFTFLIYKGESIKIRYGYIWLLMHNNVPLRDFSSFYNKNLYGSSSYWSMVVGSEQEEVNGLEKIFANSDCQGFIYWFFKS